MHPQTYYQSFKNSLTLLLKQNKDQRKPRWISIFIKIIDSFVSIQQSRPTLYLAQWSSPSSNDRSTSPFHRERHCSSSVRRKRLIINVRFFSIVDCSARIKVPRGLCSFFWLPQGPSVLAPCRVMRGTPGIIATTRRAVLPSRSLWCHRSALVTIRSPWHRTRTIAAEFLPGDRVATTIDQLLSQFFINFAEGNCPLWRRWLRGFQEWGWKYGECSVYRKNVFEKDIQWLANIKSITIAKCGFKVVFCVLVIEKMERLNL